MLLINSLPDVLQMFLNTRILPLRRLMKDKVLSSTIEIYQKIKTYPSLVPMNSKTLLSTSVNGRMDKDTEEVNNTGTMVHSMKVTGETIWPMVKVD